MKPLLVGELNPYGCDPGMALYHLPRKASGNRLRLHLGLKDHEYEFGFDKVNLCTGHWSQKDARVAAASIAEESHRSGGRVLVLLGGKVAKAFGRRFSPFTGGNVFFGEPGQGGVFTLPVYQLPHPSGLNLLWNPPEARERARELLRVAGVLPVTLTPREEVLALPGTDCTTRRPARCSNCGLRVEGEDCPECGPPR